MSVSGGDSSVLDDLPWTGPFVLPLVLQTCWTNNNVEIVVR
jgi:hypothetical protein